MKTIILSSLIAFELLGNTRAQIITITDLSNGQSTNYASQYFNGTLLEPNFINVGDDISLDWAPNSTPTPPGYASYSSQSSNGVGFIGVAVGTSLSGEALSYSNIITINGATSTLSTGSGVVGGVNPPGGEQSWNVSMPTNFSTNFIVSNTNPINWATSYTATYSEQSAYWDYVYDSGSGQYDQIRSWATNSETYNWTESVTIQPAPEPSTYLLFGIGAIGMLVVIRRNNTKQSLK